MATDIQERQAGPQTRSNVLRFHFGSETHVEPGTDVERINQFAFYDIGRTLKQLASYQGAVHPTRVFSDVLSAGQAVSKLISGDPIPLGVSKGPADSLNAVIEAIMEAYFRETTPDGEKILKFPEETDASIPSFYLDWYRRSLHAFELVFGEEMREAATYFVPRRGIFYTPALVDGADETFPKDVLPLIPQKSRDEWCAAGRCIAFNILSASGFHVARAVEGMLEAYYTTFCGRSPPEGRSWGHLIGDLEGDKLTPKPNGKTLAEIRQMKDDYRNPLMHPRVVLSESDARMLFANGESVIIAMAQEIREIARTNGGVQPSLAVVEAASA